MAVEKPLQVYERGIVEQNVKMEKSYRYCCEGETIDLFTNI